MRIRWESVARCWVAAALLLAAGCGSGSEDDSNTGTPPGSQSGGTPDGPGDAGGEGTPAQAESPRGSMPGMPVGAPSRPVFPVVRIETSIGNTAMGSITVRLDDEKAPSTAASFLRYVEKGFYDGTIFHQVHPKAVILGGMYTEGLAEKEADLPIRSEANNGLKNTRGTIAMARQYDDPHSATCQFFINVKDNPNYDYQEQASGTSGKPEDYGYCVFGKVTEGMDVVDQIASVEVRDTPEFERFPAQTVRIDSVRLVR